MAGAFKALGWPDLSAGGTVRPNGAAERAHVLWRVWLLIELCILYIGIPVWLYQLVHGERVPLFLLLPPVLLAFIVVLLWDRSFLLRRELIQGMPWRELFSILVVFLIGGGAVAAYVQQEMPGAFLSFPTQRPETWQRVMILYPLASVVAQELVYRTFFFHRYGPLFEGLPWVMILANGMLFGVAHMLFGNWVAVIGTGVIGCLLAYRYAATRSLWAVVIEHTLWGWLVFTVGLGGFFFTGVSNMPAWRMFEGFLKELQTLFL